MQFTTLLTALAFGSAVNAHMSLQFPEPFRAKYNPNYAGSSNIDYSLTSPLNPDGSNFPCKGYQSDLGTAEGASVVNWSAGGAYNFSLTGGATHNGGSCQIALSYDKGVSWKVIHSYIGSCPLSIGQTFDFTLPSDAPTGASLFGWTWFNEVGNREIYMNCAAVTIDKGSGSAPSTKFADRPDLFVANLENGCSTDEGKEAQFPDPGPADDVTTKNTVADNSGSIVGTCAAVHGIGGGSGSTGGSPDTTSPDTTSPDTTSPDVDPPAGEPTADPTTLSTITTTLPPTTTTVAVGAVSPGVFATVTAPDTASPTENGTTGSGSTMTAGSSCSTEGTWNCIDATSYQRCASGQWSVVQPLAAGTKCTSGQSEAIDISAIASRRNIGRHRVRHSHRDSRA